MKVLINNVAGLNMPHKLHRALHMARDNDITMYQEVKLKRSQASHVRSKWGSPNSFLSCSTTSRRGVLTLLHPRTDPVYLHEVSDPEGQFHILVVRIKGETYLVVNVYGVPDSDRGSEHNLIQLSQHMDAISSNYPIQHTIMGGDWNFVLRPQDTTSSSRKPRAEAVLSTILDTMDLYDVAALQSTFPGFTYFRHHLENTKARYDRIYVSPSILNDVRIRLLPRTGDHTPVQMLSTQNNSPKTWRFPDRLLEDPTFIQGLHDTLRDTLKDFSEPRDCPLVEYQNNIDFEVHPATRLISTIITRVRDYGMRKTKERFEATKAREDSIIQRLITAREALNNSSAPDETLTSEFEEAKRLLTTVQTSRALAASDMNYTQYSGFGERSSRYHFLRSGRGKASREISKLTIHTPDGTQILENSDIPQHMFDKYAEIVQEDPIAGTMSIDEFLGPELTESLRKCPPEHHAWLESPILSQEIDGIIKDLKTVSAPGPLGISNNLLKAIHPYILKVLTRFGEDLLFSEERPNVDPFFFHRMVIFILKPGKDPMDPDSYRGLSLLENVFKLYSKLLANRMERPLKQIQNPQQFGFTRRKGILEASRCVIDTIRHAHRKNKPLIVISTDFKKAFDSISLDHIENCLRVYQFPDRFRIAIMRLVRNGTMQFQINSSTSQDHELKTGSGQGDPKSSGIFNLSVQPLNHYLAKSPEVPRYEVDGVGVEPVSFADDNLLLLQGDKIEQIMATIRMIQLFRRVSGLFLNPPKCEIMSVNCREEDILRLAAESQMKRVTTIKHLGLHINDRGEVPHETNIAPIERAMNRIADTFTTVSSTPLGRSIYAKYLLASRYLHKVQNFEFSQLQLTSLRASVLRLTWTRHRMGTDTSSTRVHIAGTRVSQPLAYGGLSIPDPIIQSKSIRFGWGRKFLSPSQNLSWVRILEEMLRECGRPDIQTHLNLGFHDWKHTATAIDSQFWSGVFNTIAELMALSHEFDRYWHLVPITGYELNDFSNIDQSSLSYTNPPVKNMVDAGLINIGQLFHLNQAGLIDRTQPKTYEVLEQEFSIEIPPMVRNSLEALSVQVRRRFTASNSYTPLQSSTLRSLITAKQSGCSEATRLLLKQERRGWSWGEFPHSFLTYSQDHLIDISSQQFSMAFKRTRSSTLSPSIQWTSLQVLLRTLWTRVKESNTARNTLSTNPVDQSCSNCHNLPEHTTHLLYECQLALQVWEVVQTKINESATRLRSDFTHIEISRNQVMFNHPPAGLTDQEKRDVVDIIMVVKHVLYRLKFRDDLNRIPSTRLVLTISAMEVDKALMVRSYLGKPTNLLSTFMQMIKSHVGF